MISFLFSENQPTPPAVDCIRGNCVKSQQAQKLRLSLEFSGNIADLERVQIDPDQLAADLERFCLFRNDGDHALPANCDVFIKCSNGFGSYDFCQNGTKFNPSFLTCDHPVNHECRFETRKLFLFLYFILINLFAFHKKIITS